MMQRKERPVVSSTAIDVEESSSPNLPQGACPILSAGVLAVVEGPSHVVDEFQQLHASPKSKQDPSTTASPPPLRRFLPQQISRARAAVLILRAGVWGQPAHMSAISFPPETEPAQDFVGPLLSAETLELNIRLRLCRAKKSAVSLLRALWFSEYVNRRGRSFDSR